MKKFAIFLLFLVLGCSNLTGNSVKTIPREFSRDIEVYFCPRDNCGERLVNFISNAKTSVHCALFDLEIEGVISALAEKSKYLDVKLVVDGDNLDELNGRGIRFDDSKQFTHNKFCVVDGNAVWTGSFNPTYNGANYNNNNVVVFYSKYLAENYEDEFTELWNLNFGSGKRVKNSVVYLNNIKIENFFCPEDYCEARIANTLNKAKHSVRFMIFTFTSEPIGDALLFLEDVDIKGIFEKRQRGRYSQFERLKDFGLDVWFDSNPKTMHHKVFIVDEKIVITGSYNPTNAANTKNDENILVIYDKGIARKFLDEFNYLWQDKTI
jgi:phosphatidylserine/phosphatidylglycerophosphate/cardiolipin synthase-like enzyme